MTRADAEDRGLITGYYEPLLKGSRTEDRALLACRCIRAPDDLLSWNGDLTELEGKAGARPSDRHPGANAWCHFDRAQIDVNALTATSTSNRWPGWMTLSRHSSCRLQAPG